MQQIRTRRNSMLTRWCVSLALLALAGCGGGNDSSSPNTMSGLPAAVQNALTKSIPVSSTLVSANNNLGFTLFDQLRSADPTSNVFISPTSVALALNMTYNGASGTTQQGMAQALQEQGISLQDLNSNNAALLASLVSPDPKVQLNVANSLWVRNKAIKQSFIDANTTYFGADLGDMSGAPGSINAWVSQKTNGKITQIVPTDLDYTRIAAVLVNAIYFKGAWTSMFDPASTGNAPFTLSDGTKKSAPMMHQEGNFNYYKGNQFQMVRLPYGQGRMSMILLLPNAGTSLDTLLTTVNAQNWNTWLDKLQPAQGTIALPRFTSDYSASLKASLTALGMGQAFDPTMADFSAMNADPTVNLYIAFVQHKTTIAVTEEGTEATGATSVGIGTTSIGANPFQMSMDHPFFYAIRDDKTGELLFLGKLMDPTL